MIGIDVISISRVDSSIKKFNKKFLLRYLNDNEITYIKSAKNAAGFWAAKEAVSKALGTGIGKDLSFHDIILSKSEKGVPLCDLSDIIKKRYSIKNIAISITHDAGLAIAVAIIKK